MKENKQPILSICIPTWNRWYSLQYTLKSIMDQDEFKSGDVEIVISDNASTDETENEVKKLCKVYKNIRYYKNEMNIGGNPNINKVISLGCGEYLWILGSDSIILRNGIKKTLNIIQEKSPSIIYNSCIFVDAYEHLNSFYDKYLGIHFFKNFGEYFLFLGDQYKYDYRSFQHIEHLLTFISSICISKKYYTESLGKIILNYSGEYLDNNYFSQELICFFGDAIGGICIIDECCIDRFKGKKTTYFVNKKIIKDRKELIQFITKKYKINSKSFKKLKRRSLYFWYKEYILGKIIKFLINVGVYKSCISFYRKLKNIKSNTYIERIDYS